MVQSIHKATTNLMDRCKGGTADHIIDVLYNVLLTLMVIN